MPKDDDKLIRQLSLVSFLLSRSRPATAGEIRVTVEGYYGMTDVAYARRFFGDRDDLARAGISIESATSDIREGGEVYYLPQENFRLPDLSFSAEELKALTIALGLLHGRFAYERPLRLALSALTRGRPNPADETLEGLALSVESDEEREDTLSALARMEEGITRGKSVCFDYFTMYRHELNRRTLDPYCLVSIDGHWYAVGYDHDRGAVRTFRLGRVRGAVTFATKNARDFRIPEGFDAREYRTKPPWLLGSPSGVAQIRVQEDIAWWVRQCYPDVRPADSGGEPDAEPHVEQEPTCADGDGWCRFSTPYSDPEPLLNWVIGMGRRAELTAPPSLRTALADTLESIAGLHGAGPKETLRAG